MINVLACQNLWVAYVKKRSYHTNACVQEYNKGGRGHVCIIQWRNAAASLDDLSLSAGPLGPHHPRHR